MNKLPPYPTPKQKKVLDFIKKYLAKNGYAPTLQEMADDYGCTIVTVHQFLKSLERRGLHQDCREEASPEAFGDLILPRRMR